MKYLNGTFEDFYALLQEAVTPAFLYDVFLNPSTRVTDTMPVTRSPAESQKPEWWRTPFGDYRENLRKVIIRPKFIEPSDNFGTGKRWSDEGMPDWNHTTNLQKFFEDYSAWEQQRWISGKCEAYVVGFRIIWFESLDRYYELECRFTVVLRTGLNNPAVRRPENFLYFEFPTAQFLEVNKFPGLWGRGERQLYPSNRVSGRWDLPPWNYTSDSNAPSYPRESAWLPFRGGFGVAYSGGNAMEFQFDDINLFRPGIPYLELDWTPDVSGLNYPLGA